MMTESIICKLQHLTHYAHKLTLQIWKWLIGTWKRAQCWPRNPMWLIHHAHFMMKWTIWQGLILAQIIWFETGNKRCGFEIIIIAFVTDQERLKVVWSEKLRVKAHCLWVHYNGIIEGHIWLIDWGIFIIFKAPLSLISALRTPVMKILWIA